MLKIRKARKEDFDLIVKGTCEIVRMCIGAKDPPVIPGVKECFEEMLNDPKHHYIAVAEYNGKQAGYASVGISKTLHFAGRSGDLQDLYVDDAYRKHGVGKALMQHVDEFAQKEGLMAVDLHQLPVGSELDEERNLFYKRAGYELGGFTRQKFFFE